MKNVLGRGLSSLVSAQAVPVRVPKVAKDDQEPRQGLEIVRATTQNLQSVESRGADSGIQFIPVADIAPGKYQPRKDFDEAEIRELADSITTHGVLQPVLLRKGSPDHAKQYELVAGERRWRAAQAAGLLEIPAIVREFADQETLEIAIIENVQRNDLNALEEALAYQRLANEFALTQEQISQKVGKERATVANLLRLLKLAPEVQDLVRKEELSAGHAKALLTIKEPSAQISLAKKCISEGLSVRSLESLISRVVVLDTGTRTATEQLATGQIARGGKELEAPEAFPEVVERLRNALATKVAIKQKKDGSGTIEIQYFSEKELDRLVEAIGS